MKIALDAMGGDYAPQATVQGALDAKASLPADVEIILIGDQPLIEKTLREAGAAKDAFAIIHATERVEMGENPTKAIQNKPDSDLMVGFKLLASGKVQAFCSAGNTGAMMVASVFILKTIPGVLRPVIAGFMPKEAGNYGIVIDVGANAECKPEFLAQFGRIGSLYSKYALGTEAPKVGLLSLGTEEQKGTQLTLAAFKLLKENPKINFVGNVEGRDIFGSKADVIVCDGFLGNVILKMGESMYPLLKERNFVDNFIELFNWENVGMSPILGVNGNVIVGHGASSAWAIQNMLKMTVKQVEAGIIEKITAAYAAAE